MARIVVIVPGMTDARQDLGKSGEDLAVLELESWIGSISEVSNCLESGSLLVPLCVVFDHCVEDREQLAHHRH